AGLIQERIGPVHKEIVGRFGVPGVKAALDLLGYAGGKTRPPLVNLSPREREEVARVLQRAGVLWTTRSGCHGRMESRTEARGQRAGAGGPEAGCMRPAM